jgi:serine phosphatase RsbU (regulator of sigma subunit)
VDFRDRPKTKIKYETTDHNSTKLIEIKDDKQSVGQFINSTPLTNHVINLRPMDRIYMFTDGFADQFGGSDQQTRKKGGKKFKYSNLKKLIFDLKNTDLKSQQLHFNDTFEKWKGDFEQVDDACVIGIQI